MPKEKQLHPELVNLAAKMDETDLAQLARVVIEEYDADVNDRLDWEEKHKLWAEIYYQNDDTSDPEKGWGATQSIPLLTEACNQFAARCRKSFFPNKDFITTSLSSLGSFPKEMPLEQVVETAKAMLPQYRMATERVRKHMNYQLTVQDVRYKRQKDALWLSMAVHGSVFTKAYWDVDAKQPRVDTVRAVDLVVPYSAGPVAIDDVPRKTHKLFIPRLRTLMWAQNGFFTSECKPVANLSEHMSIQTQAADRADGIEPTNNADSPHSDLCFILEQHRFWEYENRIVPVIVWVDYETKAVKRLAIRYETDDAGEPINDRRPIEYFTHYKFLENPDGFYGYGYGHMLGSINTAINQALRDTLDAAKLANDGNMSGFISQRLVPQDDAGTEIQLSLGKFTTLPDTVENIGGGIKTMDFKGPNAALVDMMQFLDQRGQRLGSVTEATTGQVDKIRQSNALMTELEQALELPSNIHMRIVDSLTDELAKIYRLNRVNLDERVVFVIDDEVAVVTRDDYTLDAIVVPVFDPKMATLAQKISRAQTELDAVMKNPLSQNDPEVINTAFERYFKAIESEDYEDLIPEMPEPPEMRRIDNQYEENSLFLMPPGQVPPFDVFPDQDHQQHLAIIDEFVNSPYVQELDPQAAEALKAHRQKHIAFLYATETGVPVNAGSGQEGTEDIPPEMGDEGRYETGVGKVDLTIPESGGLDVG